MSWTGAWLDVLAGDSRPASTTWPTIRDLQLELVAELAPTVLPQMRFRPWEANELDFAAWAEASAGAFRVFHIERQVDDREPRYLSPVLSSVRHTELVMVAYPRQVDLFNKRLDAIVDQDIADLTRVLGLRARADYAGISSGLLSVSRMSAFVQPGEAAVVAVVQFLLEYDRTIP